VALNVTRDRILMHELRNTAILLLALGLCVSALAGAVIVRRGLQPVEQMAAEVAEISAEELQRRLPAADRPRELIALVDSFNTMLGRLDCAFAALSQYSANLAHELRTPLNNLRGEAEVALLQRRTPEEYREVISSSLEEYERLSKMIDGLLFLARADSRETKPAWTLLSLEEEARTVSQFYVPLADEKKIAVAVRGSASVEADPVLLRRALGNLIANALHHVDPDGHVTIDIDQKGDEGATLRVIDDGRGIGADDLPHVMERFYRGSRSDDENQGGSGLGLAIVKSIIDLHRGTIHVESTPSEGTTVTLHLARRRLS
jgi:two-component system, OmpR family, heavy metal sensor histidine kinase CusS